MTPAMVMLGQVGELEAVNAVSKVALKDVNEKLRMVALEVLAESTHENARYHLQQALNDQSPRVRDLAQKLINPTDG